VELKLANPNGCDIVINNLHLMFLFFFKRILKMEFNTGLQSLFWSRESIAAPKLKDLIVLDSLIKMA
jgi:hypothetical protein